MINGWLVFAGQPNADVGQLSRAVLLQYCAVEIRAGKQRCPLAEHHHCCMCTSAQFPTVPDNGHCCADCTDACADAESVLPEKDICHGVPVGVCSVVNLMDAIMATANQRDTASTMDRQVLGSL
jgi:hypothetical protein